MVKNKNENLLNIILKNDIYPLEAVYGASYVFIDKAYIYIDSLKKGEITVRLKGKKKLTLKKLSELEGEFMNELLNYAQRLNISKTTGNIREYIVERALYSSVNENEFSKEDSAMDDPLGIAIPWEEKYGDKKQ